MARTTGSAVDLELTRVPGDRRLYALEGIGTLRLQGLLGRSAVAQSDGRSFEITSRGLWQREVVATDESGAVCGTFDPRSIRRGGTLRWGDRQLTLNPASAWRERYELAEHGSRLALLDGKGWGKRPVRLTIDDGELLEPGLALFATFVVRGLAEDASGASGGGASAAVA
jgi:hypothetical protein